ncbi:MAG: polyribonucleotide nucleotidyltransferase [Candidatus Gracilibacteria bacterium]|nr:polyribonucleotide nucleotidyltransferase [Candidatus Gracilibacteria bacterium]
MIGLSDKTAVLVKPLRKTYDIEGTKITFETGKLGLLINGAVTISDDNDNVLFVSTGFKQDGLNLNSDFFPLIVEWQEKFYATGKIGGNRFQRREGRPTDEATLTARIIDRPIRPMFPKGIVNDTQIIASVLSSSGERELGIWGIVGASLGLTIAGTPFEGPVSGCKVSLMKDNSIVFNPTSSQESEAKLNLLTAGTLDAITMVEAGAYEVSNEEMILALEKSHEIIKKICNSQIDFIEEYKKTFEIVEAKAVYNKPDETIYDEVKSFLTSEKMEVLYEKGKKEFQGELDNLDLEVREYLVSKGYTIGEKSSENEKAIDETSIGALVYKRVKEVMRANILDNSKRLDGRKLDEVRPVIGETSLLPRTHGSALFQRGMTQALSITTLGGPDDVQTLDGMMPESEKRYIHHYNFPPYSVGEVRMMRGVGRREIGHGALAERALIPVLPSVEDFPYTMRVVSEITTCNGSSSMASVCGSTMSLMNAGVPIKEPVAGVAMGMIYDEETHKYKILSDIQAQEDFLGDMDFKVARTKNGITAMQLDVKIKGLKMDVFRDAFKQSEGAIEYIIGKMLEVQPKVAEKLSPYAPLIMIMQVPVDKISPIIGKGGENVQRMEKEYNVKISIADDGMTTITAVDQIGGEKAIAEIKAKLWNPEVGYKGVGVVSKIIEGTGAIVDFKGKSGMIHISKLSYKRINNVEDVVKVGDEVKFEIVQVDIEKGRIGLKRELSEAELKEMEAIKVTTPVETAEKPHVKVEIKLKDHKENN